MDLQKKLDIVFKNNIKLNNEIGKSDSFDKLIRDNFTEEELQFLNENPDVLRNYMNHSLQYTLETKEGHLFLITDIGTFLLEDMQGKKLSLKLDTKGTIDLLDLSDILQQMVRRDYLYYLESKKPNWLLRDALEIHRYYKNVVEKNISNLSCIYRDSYKDTQSASLNQIPLELWNHKNFFFFTKSPEVFKKLKIVYDLDFHFEDNQRLMFIMIVYNQCDNSFIQNHIEEFKEFIYQKKLNSYKIDCFMYLRRYFSNALDDEFLLKLYKKNPSIYEYDRVLFTRIAQTIENKTPMVQLTSNSVPIHIRCNDYDLHPDGVPVYIKKKQLKQGNLGEEVKEIDFESMFLTENRVMVKLYQRYYKGYQKGLTDSSKDTMKDFVKELLFNEDNFRIIANDIDLTVRDINDLLYFLNCYPQEDQQNFKNFLRVYSTEKNTAWIQFYNYLVKNEDDVTKIKQLLDSCGLKQDNTLYKRIINDKFMNIKIKSYILQVLSIYFGDYLTVLDIIEIIDEMQERGMTIHEILKEKNMSQKAFEEIYEQSLQENPMLYEYIRNSLANNKKRGFKKLIRYGYKVLNSQINSLQEYNREFNSIPFEKLVTFLQKTELNKKLIEKASKWTDYNTNQKKKK